MDEKKSIVVEATGADSADFESAIDLRVFFDAFRGKAEELTFAIQTGKADRSVLPTWAMPLLLRD